MIRWFVFLPWYNRNGWLGVKSQLPTFLPVLNNKLLDISCDWVPVFNSKLLDISCDWVWYTLYLYQNGNYVTSEFLISFTYIVCVDLFYISLPCVLFLPFIYHIFPRGSVNCKLSICDTDKMELMANIFGNHLAPWWTRSWNDIEVTTDLVQFYKFLEFLWSLIPCRMEVNRSEFSGTMGELIHVQLSDKRNVLWQRILSLAVWYTHKHSHVYI